VPRLSFSVNKEEVLSCITNNDRFIKYQMPSNIISNFKNQLPVFLIEQLWGTHILGFYSVTVRVLQIPTSLLASAIGRVYFHTISKMKRDGISIAEYTFRNLTKAMKIGVMPMALLMGFGDLLAIVFLGEEWIQAGIFIQILSLQYFFMFLMTTLQGVALTIEKQEYSMYANLIQSLGFILGALIGKFLLEDIYLALIVMSISFITINILYFSAIFKVLKVSIIKYVKNILFSIISVFIIALVLRMFSDYIGLTDVILNLFR